MRWTGAVIFVTVGSQTPFDRLIRMTDEWACTNGRQKVFAQIGLTALRPKHIAYVQFLEPKDFRRTMDEADCVIAHAGTGTILTALELGKPLLVVPRLTRLGETRSDHQVVTAQRFAEQERLLVAFTPDDFHRQVETLQVWSVPSRIRADAQESLVMRIRAFALGSP